MAFVHEGHEKLELEIKKLLKKFPPGCLYAFAYGSAAFPQGTQPPGSMLDLIFVVEDPEAWHQRNLEMNHCHYSLIRWFGARTIAKVQEGLACGVYYNTYARIDGWLVKYGVMSRKALERDLVSWNQMFIAGRLHKPVLTVQSTLNSSLDRLIKDNRRSALRAALLLLPELTTTLELYHTITQLSYLGDFRMFVGENPEKVKNIVAPIVEVFDEIYLPLLKELGIQIELLSGGVILQDVRPEARLELLMGLPVTVQSVLVRSWITSSDTCCDSIETVLAHISTDSNISERLREVISSLVWVSSIRQAIAGIISSGFSTFRYAFDKLRKSF